VVGPQTRSSYTCNGNAAQCAQRVCPVNNNAISRLGGGDDDDDVPLDELDPLLSFFLGIGMNVECSIVGRDGEAVRLAIIVGDRAIHQYNIAFERHIGAIVHIVQAASAQYKPYDCRA
jgi:hypothetical protein